MSMEHNTDVYGVNYEAARSSLSRLSSDLSTTPIQHQYQPINNQRNIGKKIQELKQACSQMNFLLTELDQVSMESNLSTSEERDVSSMETRLKEALDANKKWQEYYRKAEREIKSLKESRSRTTSQNTQGQQQEMDKILLASKRRVDDALEQKEQVEDELRQAKLENYKYLEKIGQLEKELHDKQQKGLYPRGITSKTERERILELQLEQYKVDFEAEKSDKRCSKAIADDLRKRLNDKEEENEQLKERLQVRRGISYSAPPQRSPRMQRYQKPIGNHNFYDVETDGLSD